MAPTSTSMWPASASRTSEFEATAAATSNTMNVTSRTSAMVRARLSVSSDACPACPWWWPSAICRHVVRVRKDLLDEAAHVRVVEYVVDPGALPSAAHQAGQPQLGQMLRDGSGLGTHQVGQLVHRVLALEQGADDPQPGLVGQELQHPDGGMDLLACHLSHYLRRHADILQDLRRGARAVPTQGSSRLRGSK